MTDCARATVEERYLVAGNTSDLSVSQERRTAADLLIAAGRSPIWLTPTGWRSTGTRSSCAGCLTVCTACLLCVTSWRCKRCSVA